MSQSRHQSPPPGDRTLLLPSETRATPCKAVLRKTENPPTLYAQLGDAVRDVQHASGLNLDEFADALGRDKRQVARWMDGSERPQLETVFAVPRFRAALVIALARRADGVEIEQVIHVRRTA